MTIRSRIRARPESDAEKAQRERRWQRGAVNAALLRAVVAGEVELPDGGDPKLMAWVDELLGQAGYSQ
jgi:hypothetical protein